MEIIKLNKRQNFADDKKLNRTYIGFETLINELKPKKLPDNIVSSINQHIEEINTTSFADKKLRRLIEKKQGKIRTLVEKELKIVPKGYYLSIGIAVGVAIGMMIGTAIGLSLDNIALMATGIPLGVGVGLAIGARMDKKAFEEGRQLNLEIKL